MDSVKVAEIKDRMDLDVIGHYSRNDLFNFQVFGQPEIVKHRIYKS